jgi:hypothetical protein
MAQEVASGLFPGRETITEYVNPAMARQAAMEKLVEQTGSTNEDDRRPSGEAQRPSGEVDSSAEGADAGDEGTTEAGGVKPAAESPAEEKAAAARSRASARISPSAMQGMEARLSSGGPQTPRLVVTGIEHVAAVLEQLEDGLLANVPVIEPYACEGGCFGSPFLQEDFHVSLHRWEEAEGTLDLDAPEYDRDAVRAVPRRLPVTARPGIRLDADMALAIEKLGHLQDILELLPGKNCGACGAPTCTALAEDVVLERAAMADCPYIESAQREGTHA